MARYPAGIIRKTPVTPAGPLQSGAAPGVWTLAEATYWTKQGLWPIAGNFLAVEDVFSTYLYTGNGSNQTITNGIDLAGKGGLVWVKSRSAATNNFLFDTARGVNVEINSNTTDANATLANSVTAFNSTGFAVGSAAGINVNAAIYTSWTFREAPKFFDVVTYTGTGSARTIAHSLGVAPGCILIKRTDSGGTNWLVYHRGIGATNYLLLNLSDASYSGSSFWNNTAPTDTAFTVGTSSEVNANGAAYVAYLFAHDLTADGVIQCGSYTGNSSTTGPTINLGWEPQWLMIKRATVSSGDWNIFDDMRGMPVGSAEALLRANLSSAENNTLEYVSPTATGFQITGGSDPQVNGSGNTYIYIAIRRGPMKTPTVGTSVFAPVLNTGDGTKPLYKSNTVVAPDFFMNKGRDGVGGWQDASRLTGSGLLDSSSTAAEVAGGSTWVWSFMNGVRDVATTIGQEYWHLFFKRAPSFMDVVCYTGTGANLTVSHNLGVVPELMIVKSRSAVSDWQVYSANLANTEYLVLNTTAAKATGTSRWNSTTPSATTFTVGTATEVNTSAATYVAYLFASCPGVSKVGSYTGNGSSQTINCGFSNGARFFLVKRTDSTGDWWVWDSARGIVAAADPALALNSTAAEVTSADAVDTESTGIIVNQETTCNINVNGATYIFLAIA